ncbi:MAG: CPBP family intramembrane metalloprotease [Myxococcaceae bacterium]|nr:CPBP family intramembrane metalloprotease [Myxococcaceae bacterium]
MPALSPSGLASLVLLLAAIGFYSVGAMTQLASLPFGLAWSQIFVLFGVPYVALRLAGLHPFRTTGFTRPWVAGCAAGFALGVANFFAVVAPTQFISQKLAPKRLLEIYDSTRIFQDRSPAELAALLFFICVGAPLAEEYLFRGTIQRGWAQRMGPVGGIVLAGAVFSAFHGDPIGFAARWELGVLFGLLAWRSGSLWPGIFAHLANNLTSTVLYFSLKDLPEDPTEDASSLYAISGIGGVVLLGVLLVLRRYPGALKSPAPMTDTPVERATPSLPLKWFAASMAAIGVLLVADLNGSMVRAVEAVTPLKDAGVELQQQRQAVLEGKETIGAYFESRRAAGLQRSAADAGTADAGTAD